MKHEILQLKIAEEMGWTGLNISEGDLFGIPPGLGKDDEQLVPNWPDSFDVARELPLKDDPAEWVVFAIKLARIFWGEEVYPEKWTDACMILYYTAEQWCLAWLLYRGWLWVECTECGGTGAGSGPDGESDYCPECYPGTEGGKWERVKP